MRSSLQPTERVERGRESDQRLDVDKWKERRDWKKKCLSKKSERLANQSQNCEKRRHPPLSVLMPHITSSFELFGECFQIFHESSIKRSLRITAPLLRSSKLKVYFEKVCDMSCWRYFVGLGTALTTLQSRKHPCPAWISRCSVIWTLGSFAGCFL